MDLSNIATTTDRAALARYASDVSAAAEWVTDATSSLENAIADYADRVYANEADAEAARVGLYHRRRELTTAESQLDRLTAAYPSSSQTAWASAPRDFGGYTNAETQSVIRCVDSDARAVEIAAAIVATAWNNAADQVAADRAAIVAPRTDAADDLRDWLETEENPLAESASLFADLLTHALARVDWGAVADHYAPDPLPSLEPLASFESEAEAEEPCAARCRDCGWRGLAAASDCPQCGALALVSDDDDEQEPEQTDPADIEPGYLSADEVRRSGRMNRRR